MFVSLRGFVSTRQEGIKKSNLKYQNGILKIKIVEGVLS
jgi:hypothetical protein